MEHYAFTGTSDLGLSNWEKTNFGFEAEDWGHGVWKVELGSEQ